MICEAIGLDYTTVHRWRLPKERSGTGGLIPFKHHGKIIALGERLNRPIQREKLMPELEAA